MHVHQSLKGIVIAQVSECPSLMVKPTFCGQTRKVGYVPTTDIQRDVGRLQAKTTVPSLRQSRLAQALKNMFVIGRVPVLP